MADPQIPDWLAQQDAQEAATSAPSTPANAQQPPTPQQVQVPAWLQQQDAAEAPESVTVTADTQQPSDSLGDDAKDFLANTATGIGRIPGALIGTPHVLMHTLDWLGAKLANMADGGSRTGADVDAKNPIDSVLPTSEGVDKRVFGALGVKPYEPTSFLGKLYQAAVTGAGAGLVDPAAALGIVKGAAPVASMLEGAVPRMAKTAIAADAANATQQAFPDSPGLAAGAALLAHTAAGTGATAAARGYRTFAEPLVRPVTAAEAMAGKALTGVDHTGPGIASPSTADVDYAAAQTRGAVGDIGDGTDDYTAGGNIRTALAGRRAALVGDRKAAADTAGEAFRAEQPMPAAAIAPFMSSPTFRGAVKAASNSVLDRGDKPLTGYWDFNEAGDPILVPNAAVPPDVLARVREKLGDALGAAKGSDRDAIGNLVSRFDGALRDRYPDTYPQTREEFAANSVPINQMDSGASGRVLDGETKYGRTTYSMPQDKIPDMFLRSKAQKTDFDSLISAYGGDKAAATQNLEDNLASKVQGAITGDGTLSLDAFNRAVRPYTTALKTWFPQLAQKFSTAEAAQRTLETIQGQKAISDDITAGNMRDSDGFVTRTSMNRWLNKNEAQLDKTQSKAAVLRLKQIANALPESPSAAPEATIEAAPMIAGASLGGLEAGVLGGITHKIPAFLAAPQLSKFRNAYSQAVEDAVRNPMAAQDLVKAATKRGGSQSMWSVLRDNAAQAARQAIPAANAGTLPN